MVNIKGNQDTRSQASLALATFITPEKKVLMDKGIMESLSGQVIDFGPKTLQGRLKDLQGSNYMIDERCHESDMNQPIEFVIRYGKIRFTVPSQQLGPALALQHCIEFVFMWLLF